MDKSQTCHLFMGTKEQMEQVYEESLKLLVYKKKSSLFSLERKGYLFTFYNHWQYTLVILYLM